MSNIFTKKIRLDSALAELKFYDTVEKANRAILAGETEINGDRNIKPGIEVKIKESADEKEIFYNGKELKIVVRDKCPYVSRGGYKLAAALDKFEINPNGMTAVDIGASTGGFTDCLLQRGAKKVYAVDCGTGQLHSKIRNDKRVIVMEKTNARYLNRDLVPEIPDIVVIDVSFISLKMIFPVVNKIGTNGTIVIALIKPQFEVEKGKHLINGVVKDVETRQEIVNDIEFSVSELNWKLIGGIESPIIGPAGNHEYLLVSCIVNKV
ncbi:TlyA family RNA methyltransferase [bacterium]|nr:TlyA family RNA methyltransferase [bacterium]